MNHTTKIGFCHECKTWTKHSTSERALIEPRACMASLIHVDQELKSLTNTMSRLENKSWLFFQIRTD